MTEVRMNILIAYASARGSTREIAERIAARLGMQRHQCEVLPLDRVSDVKRYQAAIIGSAIHDQAWLPEAIRFVSDNSATLVDRPVWLFGVGMPAAMPWPFRTRAAAYEKAKAVAAIGESIHPRGDELFSGVFRSEQLPPVKRLIFRLLGGRFGDFRDWPGIDAWADGIAHELSASTSTVQDGELP